MFTKILASLMTGTVARQSDWNRLEERRRRGSHCFCGAQLDQGGNCGKGKRIHCSPLIEQKTSAIRLIEVCSAHQNSAHITMDHGFYHGLVNEFGERNGRGRMAYTQGDKYIGEFLRDRRHGMGKYMFADGCEYIGEWKIDLFDGIGTYRDTYGNIYYGRWKKGMKNGLGMYIFADGRVEVGLCAANSPVGMGIQWSADRTEAFEVIDGSVTRKVPILCAKKASEINGLPIPEKDKQSTLPVVAPAYY